MKGQGEARQGGAAPPSGGPATQQTQTWSHLWTAVFLRRTGVWLGPQGPQREFSAPAAPATDKIPRCRIPRGFPTGALGSSDAEVSSIVCAVRSLRAIPRDTARSCRRRHYPIQVLLASCKTAKPSNRQNAIPSVVEPRAKLEVHRARSVAAPAKQRNVTCLHSICLKGFTDGPAEGVANKLRRGCIHRFGL